jgi:hypothetical protein
MERDKDVLQFILEQLEDSGDNIWGVWSDRLPEGHSFDSLAHHAQLLNDEDLVKTIQVERGVARGRVATSSELDKSLLRVQGPTLDGYDYLDELRE